MTFDRSRPLLLLLVLVGCNSPDTRSITAEGINPIPVSSSVSESTSTRELVSNNDVPMRVAWTRDLGDGTDIFSRGDQLILMGFDSRDERGEHVILDDPASYAKPLITPSGNEVVFSIRNEEVVYVTRWDGTGRHRVADGFGLAVWADPNTRREWVYVGVNPQSTDPPSYQAVRRYPLDNPLTGELVWDAQPVSDDSFQISADGRFAGALFPWPNAGIADLASGTWKRLGHGCWTAIANDESHVMWYFDAQHRNVTMVDVETDRRWLVNINGAPGIDGYEVYHPRWTNNPRFLALTGPYTVGSRDNKIRGGGRQVEVYVGRFNAELTAVDEWTKITNNDFPDFYPDAWVKPGSWSDGPSNQGLVAASEAKPTETAPMNRLVVEARPRRAVAIPSPRSIAPYKQGLLAMDYEIVELIEGSYEHSTLVAAHWIIRDGDIINDAERPPSETYHLTLELYDDHPELEGQRLVMDTKEFALPLYYDISP